MISQAVTALRDGGIIAYPTEGVWGLGCDPFNEAAVMKLLLLKERPVEKGLILIAAEMAQIPGLLAGLNTEQRARLESTWPGPITWLLPDPGQSLPGWIRGKFATVAVRVSAHPVARELCEQYAGMIVSTSANPANRPPALSRQEVCNYFGDEIDVIVPGELGGQHGPSIIRDLASNQILRM